MWRATRGGWRETCLSPCLPFITCHFLLLAVLIGAPRLCAANPAAVAVTNTARVVIAENKNAILDFSPADNVVQQMADHAVMALAGETNVSAAWRRFVTTNDIVGIKVFSGGGEISGTRPATVAAVVHGLADAGLPKDRIIIWDKREDDLRAAGFFTLGKQLGVRVAACLETGYDPTNFYLPDSPVIGNLLYGDLEFGKKGEGIGRRSFVSKLVSRQITKIISVAPLLNENGIGVCGQLFSMSLGSVDNTFRFEGDPDRLAIAVPEIYALPVISDKVALNITDALLGQYEGGAKGLLHYSEVLNQLWFSRDPVALDTLAVAELDRERKAHNAPRVKPNLALYSNAALLRLGLNNTNQIQIETIR
jgi:hypothetical protein